MAKSREEQSEQGGEASTEAEVVAEAEAALPEGVTDTANYVSKVTVAACGGNPGLAKAENKRVPCMWLAGICTTTKIVHYPITGEDFIALVGQFFAKNLQTGSEWRSGVAYLPAGYHEPIVEEIERQIERRKLAEDDPNHRSKFEPVQVEFSMQFDAQPAKNPSGYSYVAANLLPISKATPLQALLDRSVASGQLQLPAPKAA